MEPVFYARPLAAGRVLDVVPSVASWDVAGSQGQTRSGAFIDGVCASVARQMAATRPPLAFRLDVGLAGTAPLYASHDLDNYLFPLVPRLQDRTRREFVSVWASKRHGAVSSVAAGAAVPVDDPRGARVFDVTTTASASTRAYKEQIRDAIVSASQLPGEGVAMQLAFVVGPRRAWANLWKPTIDALSPILGRDDGAREWNPRDGRITDLGMHCTVDWDIANEVRIAIRASPTEASSLAGGES